MTSLFRERARMAFNYADVEFKGTLTKHQYKIAMTAVFGQCPDKAEVKRVLGPSDRISYEEFECWVRKKSIGNKTCVNAEMLFALLDASYKGYLVLEDLTSASKSVDLKISSAVWQIVYREMDIRGKGRIHLDEFLYAFQAA